MDQPRDEKGRFRQRQPDELPMPLKEFQRLHGIDPTALKQPKSVKVPRDKHGRFLHEPRDDEWLTFPQKVYAAFIAALLALIPTLLVGGGFWDHVVTFALCWLWFYAAGKGVATDRAQWAWRWENRPKYPPGHRRYH